MALGYTPIGRLQMPGPFKPVAGNGAMYVIAFKDWPTGPDGEPDPLQPCTIAAFKSVPGPDFGIIFDQVGGEIDAFSPDLPIGGGPPGTTADIRTFAAAKDPGTNKIWVGYYSPDPVRGLVVRYFSMETDSWSTESPKALVLTQVEISDAPRKYIGHVCVAANLNGDVYVAARPGAFEIPNFSKPQVYWRKLTGGTVDPSLGTWGVLTRAPGQDDTTKMDYGAAGLMTLPLSGKVILIYMFSGDGDGIIDEQPYMIAYAVDDGTGSPDPPGAYFEGAKYLVPCSTNGYDLIDTPPANQIPSGLAIRMVDGAERISTIVREVVYTVDGYDPAGVGLDLKVLEYDHVLGDWFPQDSITQQLEPAENFIVQDGDDRVYCYYERTGIDGSGDHFLCRKLITDNDPVVIGNEEVYFDQARFINPPGPLFGWIRAFGMQTGSSTTLIGINYLIALATQFGPILSSPTPVNEGQQAKNYKAPVREGNMFDCCLEKFYRLISVSGIDYRAPSCNMIEGSNGYLFPEMGKEFWQRGVVPTPDIVDGDVVVMSVQVPVGYNGLIYGISCRYSGAGFVDGGGDIEWRLKIGPVWARNMGRVLFQLGSPNQPLQLSDHIRVRSGQILRWIVNAPNGSGVIVPVTTKITCAIQGWFYPMNQKR